MQEELKKLSEALENLQAAQRRASDATRYAHDATRSHHEAAQIYQITLSLDLVIKGSAEAIEKLGAFVPISDTELAVSK